MTASSFAVMGLQLGYAAITSRLLAPNAFGAYAVALSGVGLIGMLGGSSLGQAAARRDHDSVRLDRSLVSLAVIIGSFTALVALMLAPLWGRVWGVPESTQVTQVLALGMPLTALSAVLAGILRRGGRTSAVAGRTGVGQVAGMALGLAAILTYGSVWSLGVASAAGSVVTASLLATALPWERQKPAWPTSASIEDAVYGAKSAGMNLLRFGTEQLPAWSLGRFVGAPDLGAFNRATTLLTVPMGALQHALTYSLFPELRPQGPGVRNGGLTDIMVLIAWPALFAAGTGYFAAGPLITLLLGSGWETAGSIAGIALLVGVLQLVRTPLGSALEAQGLFRTTFVGWVLSALVTGIGATATAYTKSVMPAVLGLVIASLSAAAVYLIANARTGSLSISAFARGTQTMLIIQAFVTGFLSVTTHLLHHSELSALAYVGVVGSIELGFLWAIRRRTAFWQIGAAHQLPGFTAVKKGPTDPSGLF